MNRIMINKNVKWVGISIWKRLEYVGKNPLWKLWYIFFPPVPEMETGKYDKHKTEREI